MHEPSTVLEVMINKDVWNGLSPDLQAIFETATADANVRSAQILNKANFEALKEMTEKHGVKVEKTPDDIHKKVLETWDQIAKEEMAKNPFFKKVYDSQRAYASQVVPARRAVHADYRLGADYYWPEK